MITNKQTSFNVLDKYKDLPLEEIQRISASTKLPFAVAMVNIFGDLNCGFIIRTSECLGAEKVFIFGKRKWDRRSAVGSNNYIPVDATATEIDPFDWDSTLQSIRVNGYYPVVVEQGGKPIEDFKPVEYGKPCLIFGSEDMGIPQSICETEICYSIPQVGVLRSLNVASAAAIAIYKVSTVLSAK